MKAATTLANLKKVDWSNAEASLWCLYYEGRGENAPTTLRMVTTTPRLQRSLREILVGQIARAKSVKPYAYETSDLDDEEALVVTSDRDLLKSLVAQIEGARKSAALTPGAAIHSLVEILSAAGYLIRLDAKNGETVHGFKKMPESVGTKRRLFEVVFNQLELDEEVKTERFRLSKVVDAFHYSDTSFVLSKRDFESGLRYREAMQTSARAAIDAIAAAGVLADAQALLGDKDGTFHRMRRLAGIGKNPRFKDPKWLEKVRTLSEKHGWKLKFDAEGRIHLSEDDIELILTLLRDRRAITLIFDEMIDAEVARSVEA